jgi:hypothetical protein
MPRRQPSPEAKPLKKPAGRRGRTGHRVASNPEGTSRPSMVSHQEIATRAYALFLARGGQHGDDWADWFRAEAEVRETKNRGGRPAGRPSRG